MHDRILQSLYRAVDEINMQRSKRDHLAKSEATSLSDLDSLGLANFVVLTEQEIDNEFGRSINLLEEGTLLDSSAGPQTIGSLARIIAGLLERGEDG
jgi:hypothetical protein